MATQVPYMACKIGRSVIETSDGDNGRVVLVCEVAQDVGVPSQKGA
tara:strand:+ start:4373 stop:4510 length:138 start_codon:yes stop_codon:yes gene_type:complete